MECTIQLEDKASSFLEALEKRMINLESETLFVRVRRQDFFAEAIRNSRAHQTGTYYKDRGLLFRRFFAQHPGERLPVHQDLDTCMSSLLHQLLS